MQRRSILASFVLLAAVVAFATLSSSAQDKRGRKYKAPPPTARIEVTVVRNTDSKPIENAAVVFQPMQGSKSEGNMELKTNEDGKTIIDVIPIGDTVRLQIIAKGFQTYGQDYKVEKDQMAIAVRLKRPGEQYSIYKHHDGQAQNNNDQNKDQNNKDQASKDKPQDSSKPQN